MNTRDEALAAARRQRIVLARLDRDERAKLGVSPASEADEAHPDQVKGG